MRGMWNKLREHYIVCIAAFVMAVLVLFPVIYFRVAARDAYQGINIPHFGTDAHFYLSRAREAFDGHRLGNPLLHENKNGPDSFFMYTERFLMAPVRWLSFGHQVNVVSVYYVLDFVGVMLLIFLLYSLARQLGANNLSAVAAAVFAIGGYSIVYNKVLFYNDFNIYGRPTIPFTSSVITFLYLNLFLKTVRGGSRRYFVGAAIALGALFNMYFYAWSFALAFNGVMGGLYLCQKDWARFRQLAIITIGGLMLGAYNLYSLFSYLTSDVGKQSSYFLLLARTHVPIFSKISFGVLILFIWFFYKKRKSGEWLFILGFIITSWVVLNEQILTGRSLQYGHYYWYFIVPLSIVVGIYMLWVLLSATRYQMVFSLVLIALAIVNSVVGQYRSSLTNFNEKKQEQEFRPLIDFLNVSREPSVVLTTDNSDGYLFTIYTPHDLFWNSGALLLNTPTTHIEDTFLVYAFLNKKARLNFPQFLRNLEQDRQQWPVYRDLYEDLEGLWSGKDYGTYQAAVLEHDPTIIPGREETVRRLTKDFFERASDADKVEGLLQKYSVRYIVWDEKASPEWDLSDLPDLVERVHNGRLHLYEIK